MTTMRGKTKPRSVHLLAGEDFQCALMGSLGFSTRLITEQTGLTISQVGYRLRIGGIKRMDYRNGTSPVALSMLRKAAPIAVSEVQEHLRQVLDTRNPKG